MGSLPERYAAASRDIDDFCPVVQLSQLISSKGPPDVQVYRDSQGDICAKDRNNTWQKISADLPQFVNNIAGKDLKETVQMRAEEVYIYKL